MRDQQPILVRGMSRSGGTLMVTALDAHPAIAMSYEFYPSLFEKAGGDVESVAAKAEAISRFQTIPEAAKAETDPGWKKFILRCPRSGIDLKDIRDLLNAHAEAERDLNTEAGRLLFVQACCQLKAKRENAVFWGVKCSPHFEQYQKLWPDACFINVIRDGRDVLASQLNTGDFQITPKEVGRSWARNHSRFKEFASQPGVKALEVYYERLVREPVEELRRITEFLDVDYSEDLLEFHKKDLTIHRTRHMSGAAVAKPFADARIGRWRRDLERAEVQDFMEEAADMMLALGYDTSVEVEEHSVRPDRTKNRTFARLWPRVVNRVHYLTRAAATFGKR